MCLPGGFTLQGGVETALSQTDCWLASHFNNQNYGPRPRYSALARKILHFWQRTGLTQLWCLSFWCEAKNLARFFSSFATIRTQN